MKDEFEKICYYKSDDILILPLFLELSCCEEIREKQGYIKSRFASPYHYQHNDFFDIFIFTNNNNESICEYWDHNGCVFTFATKNQNETFECVKDFTSLLKDVCEIEMCISSMEDYMKVRIIQDD